MWKHLLWVLLSLGIVLGAAVSKGDQPSKGGIKPGAANVSFRCCAPPPECWPGKDCPPEG